MPREDGFADDEWDPPALNMHLPFPPPILLDLDLLDTGPLCFGLLEGWYFYQGFHTDPWWQPWFVWVGVAVCLAWLLNTLFRPQGRRFFAWVPVLWRHFSLLLWARVTWRPISVHRIIGQPDRSGHRSMVAMARAARAVRLTPLSRHGWATILLPPNAGRRLMADVNVDDKGIVDTSGTRGPWWWRWLLSAARGVEPLCAVLHISDTGNLDLYDPEAREGVWAARQELLVRPEHRLSLYHRVRPFPVAEIARAAGSVANAEDLLQWAGTLVQRRLLMAVPAGRRSVLERRLLALMGVAGTDQHGKLGEAGLFAQRLTEEEVDELGEEAWGSMFRPALAIAPRKLEVQTGDDDPPPIGDSEHAPAAANPGVRRYVTYAITGMRSRMLVGYMEPLTGRRLLCDVAMHISPVADVWAELVLGFKSAYWHGMSLGREKYQRAGAQATRTLALLRRRETKVLQVGFYATVAETQSPVAELALNEMVGKENYTAPAYQQLEARMATEPMGRDPLGKTWWTDSQTVAAAWPGSGGIWVPGCTVIGESARSNEPVGVNLWWEGDETSVMAVLGRSGSGKTNLVQAFCGRMMEPHPDHWLARRPPPMVVAYQKSYDEWRHYCDRFRGEHYRLTNKDWRAQLAAADIRARVVAFNLMDLAPPEQVAFMSELEPWVLAHQSGRRKYPMLYVIGEAWAWAQDPALAPSLKKLALTVRGEGIGLIVDTQFLHHLLESAARDVLGAASVWVAMRMRTRERQILQDELDIGPAGMKFLAQIAQANTLAGGVQTQKGRGIIEAHGLRTTLQVKRFGFERALLDETDPRHWGIQAMLDGTVEDDEDLLELDTAYAMQHANGNLLHAAEGR